VNFEQNDIKIVNLSQGYLYNALWNAAHVHM